MTQNFGGVERWPTGVPYLPPEIRSDSGNWKTNYNFFSSNAYVTLFRQLQIQNPLQNSRRNLRRIRQKDTFWTIIRIHAFPPKIYEGFPKQTRQELGIPQLQPYKIRTTDALHDCRQNTRVLLRYHLSQSTYPLERRGPDSETPNCENFSSHCKSGAHCVAVGKRLG